MAEKLPFGCTWDIEAALDAKHSRLPRYTLPVETPFGIMKVVQRGEELAEVHLSGELTERDTLRETPLLREAARQLTAYFTEGRTAFDLPLAPLGTPFQLAVWHALIATTPYGQTVSYGELAKRAGSPAGARAVGMAMNRNPLPIVVPCHRVVASGGKLGGFGGGEALKAELLQLEGAPFRT